MSSLNNELSIDNDDIKNMNLPPNYTKLDVLAAVCGSLLLSEEEKDNNMIKKRKDIYGSSSVSKDSCFPVMKPNHSFDRSHDDLPTLVLQQGLSKKTKPSSKRHHLQSEDNKQIEKRKNTCWGSGLSSQINIYGSFYSSSRTKDSCFPVIKPDNSFGRSHDDLHTLLLQQGLSKKTKPSSTRTHLRSEEESDAENFHVKKKKKMVIQERQPHLPIEFKECIGRFNKGLTIQTEMLVIQKELHKSDICKQQNRFSIPFRSIINKFLDDNEIKYLETSNEKGVLNRMAVNLIDPSLIKQTVKLTRWEMPKDSTKCNAAVSTSYVLNGPTWAQIVASNQLQIGDEMQLWAVRLESLLWFALVRLPNKI